MPELLAKNIDADHIGVTVVVPVTAGSTITDVLRDVIHTTRTVGLPTWGAAGAWDPVTLVRLEHTRPVFDINAREGYLGEFFEVPGDATVNVSYPTPEPEEAARV